MMNLSVCTISFRHHLISLEQVTQWAKEHAFQGIELWGVHAKNLRAFPQYNAIWLQKQNLSVSMLSDYLPLQGDEIIATQKMVELCQLAKFWGTKKIRTFAGNQASKNVTESERKQWNKRLQTLCDIAAAHEIYLIVETHPETLADTLDSTLRLINEINHSHLKINFDVIHLWEAGNDPQHAFQSLAPHIEHMHLKNISDPALLDNFKPANVYAPAGNRQGMVSIFEGTFDFYSFLHFVMQQNKVDWHTLDVSLEWFGEKVMDTLNKDKRVIKNLQNQHMLSPPLINNSDVIAV